MRRDAWAAVVIALMTERRSGYLEVVMLGWFIIWVIYYLDNLLF